MRCRSCMTVNPTGNKFCEQCGTQLQQACGRCGHDLSPAARFCGNCGQDVGAGAAAGSPPTPKWGELKQATVLFADIVGSTELLAGLDPEEAMARLRPAVLRMRHSVERFGGTLVRTLGDGVMALFGVPHALEGHALLACQAALHMQKMFATGSDGLKVRIGLHSGQVASDPSDAEDGRGGGAHGLTIHLASRVVGVARPGATCITDVCLAATAGAAETLPLGLHTLKGIRDAIELHELVALHVHATASSVAGSTFRGRQHELAVLQDALQEVLQGGSRVVGVVGEPGAGKSRLCQEFAASCREYGIPVHEVRAQLYGHALPLQPILELFRVHFFGIGPHDDAATARARIALRFADLKPTDGDLGILYDFFCVAAQEATHALGPRARQARLLALLKELLRAEAELQRVILIEDLHWLDEGSEEVVSLLVDAVEGTRTFLLLNYRTSYRCPWLQLAHYEQVELRELAEADMDPLVGELLAPATQSREVRALVCRRAGGNPFFAEELVRSLVESRLLAPDSGLPHGGLEAVERALPATVEAVIGARLDRIGEPEKTLLQMCAIIGKEIPLAILAHVASPLASQIESALEGLCRAGVLLPQPSESGRRFAFRHPLIQEVAYGTQFKLRRGQVHANVAVAMELYYADRLDEYAGLIGYHFEQAGERLKAARYNARAAMWVGSTQPQRSIKHWQKVRRFVSELERGSETDRLRMRATGQIAWLSWREGLALDQMHGSMAEAIEFATEKDTSELQLLLMAQGRMLQASGESADLYVERVQRALELAAGSSPGRLAMLHTALCQAHGWAGRSRDALVASDLALADLDKVERHDAEFVGFSVQQWALAMRCRLLVRLDRIEEARACLDRLHATLDASTDPVIRQMPHFANVEYAVRIGDAPLAAASLDHVRGIADQHAAPYLRVFALTGAAAVERLRGRPDAAASCLQQALETVRQKTVALEFETEILAQLAETLRDAGQLQAALQTARSATQLCRRRSNRRALCRALTIWWQVVGADARLHDGEDLGEMLREIEALIDCVGEPALRSALAAPALMAAGA